MLPLPLPQWLVPSGPPVLTAQRPRRTFGGAAGEDLRVTGASWFLLPSSAWQAPVWRGGPDPPLALAPQWYAAPCVITVVI